MFQPEFELLNRDQIEQLQLERLQKTIQYAYENVRAYKEKLNSVKIKPQDIKSLDDIVKLPFTTKEDFRQNYPYGMFALNVKSLARIHASSGTTGKSTIVGYTKKDLDTWSNLVARLAACAGVCSDDIVHIAFGYGLFTGGFGLHYGLEKLGATVIPVSSGNTKRQIQLIMDLKPTVLVSTPSYALHIAESLKKEGVRQNDISLRIGLFGAEPWSDQMRKKLQQSLPIKAYDNYGLSEVMGPGVSAECIYQNGMHVFEDHFYAEIVDSKTLTPVKDGEYGELVITTLTKEALPVIRYRTKDITKLDKSKCACGRHMARISKPIGRSDDMIIIRGVNVFPTQIEEALFNIEGVMSAYQIVLEREKALDKATLLVEVNENIFFDEMKQQRLMLEKIKHELKTILGIELEVKLVEPYSLELSVGKAKRVIDKRNLYI
ncbi:Phenylacetate-coenzyme A ligase [Desulfurella amilsii]|uniref:Phenylacetate-coenzyme A ligase n=1 Tax=Desulfurella amilsii TaxID=1562698 RepID=A0A1X4XXD4_9BACT|nr:phenylacetate--CoA ligase [Desulfurella amilsii]OSS42201.1 Phenylacetate-coenzyme A ligase [Desulfurella amilsii]